MSLRLARVAEVHPEDHSVDIVLIDTGERFVGVQVMSFTASSSTGMNDLPTPGVPSNGKWDMTERTGCDLIAVVGFIEGYPLVVGFLFPQISQMLFADPDRRVMRHASDVYTSIDGSGNTEFYHPSGAYVRIGTSPGHEDLTGKNSDKSWAISKNTDKQVHIHVEQAGGKATVDIAPSGAIVVTTKSTVDVIADGNAMVRSPQVTLDTPETVCTGHLTVQKGLSVTGSASGASSAAVIAGTMQVQGGDVLADNISLKGHGHMEQGDGNRTSNAVT